MDVYETLLGLPTLTLKDSQQILSGETGNPPTSEYETESNSPTDDLIGQWNRGGMQPFDSTPKSWEILSNRWDEDCRNNDCCTLVSPTWRNTPSEAHLKKSPVAPRNLQQDITANSTRTAPVASWWSSRDYSSPSVTRAIVTLDVKQIGPEDHRHHPLDLEKPNIFIRKPWGIATNSRTEQIYIADREYNVVLVFGPDGEYQRKLGGSGTAPGLFNRPAGVAYDATNDRILVVDKDNHRFQAFCATAGDFLFTLGSRGQKSGQFFYPWGITASSDGQHVAVADAGNKRIQLFRSNGKYSPPQFTLSTTEYLDKPVFLYPRGIVFDKTGQFLYVTDFNLQMIFRVDINLRRVEPIVETTLQRPSGIEVDYDGNILVCDTRNNLIQIFRPDGHSLGYLKKIDGSRLDKPLDISVMPAGQMAVLDLNGRVRVF